MNWVTQISIALRIVSIVGPISLLMFGVTTFLFHFSGGQVRMEPVVRYGAYAAFAAAMLLATVAWRLWLRIAHSCVDWRHDQRDCGLGGGPVHRMASLICLGGRIAGSFAAQLHT